MSTKRRGGGVGLLLLWGVSWFFADYQAALQHYKEGRYREALREIQPAIQRNPEWDGGHLLAGLCFLRLEDYPMAEKALERAIALKCEDVVAYLAYAETAYRSGHYDKTIDTLDRVESKLVQEGDRQTCRRLKGWAYFQLGCYSDSRRELEAVIKGEQAFPQDYEYLGMSLIQLDKLDEGIPHLRTAAANPASTMAKQFLASLNEEEGANALKEKRYQEAQLVYSRICRQYPAYAGARFNLAMAEIGLKRWVDADKHLAGLDAYYSRNYRYWYYRGHVAERLKNFEDARRFYRRAIDENDTSEAQEALKRVGLQLKHDP